LFHFILLFYSGVESAVESLDHAHKFIESSQDARFFVDMIIGIPGGTTASKRWTWRLGVGLSLGQNSNPTQWKSVLLSAAQSLFNKKDIKGRKAGTWRM
jgi:hypothetical protein